MNYLYHKIPDNLTGEFLMPLNELKKLYPDVYEEHLKKYIGRESLLKLKIPFLDSLYNDFVHLTAVPPEKLDEAYREVGVSLKSRKWFKISPKLLDNSKTIVYLYKTRPLNADSSEFIPFRISDLRKYNSIGQKTRDYFKREVSAGRRILPFHLVPHILYKGHLKIKDLEAIEI